MHICSDSREEYWYPEYWQNDPYLELLAKCVSRADGYGQLISPLVNSVENEVTGHRNKYYSQSGVDADRKRDQSLKKNEFISFFPLLKGWRGPVT